MKQRIAIISMACVFPGALNPQELWQNVLAGRRAFRKAPSERLPKEYFSTDKTAPDKSYADQMAVIDGWEFDPIAFRIPPVSANASDISHWLALSTAKQAIDTLGIDLNSIDRTRAGVILGNTLAGEFSRSHNLRLRYPFAERSLLKSLELLGIQKSMSEQIVSTFEHYYKSPLPAASEDSLAGNMSNTIAGRITNYFDLGGCGYTVDGACSSSLLAISHACNTLQNNEADMMISGGVDISLDAFEVVGFAKAQALAKDDIRPYDTQAEGMLPGEGCGIFVLMREEDAKAQGLPIEAFIKGWGYSTDGAGGITAPAVDGQARALERAYQCAGYPISTVDLIEGHGTGTVLGDKVEIQAIKKVLDNAPQTPEHIWLGSIKGNIGHCKAAAGSAGLTNVIMALKNKILPPTGNCHQPNEEFGRPFKYLRPSTRGTIWPKPKDHPRRASVSSMGFGGANSHVTLEEANPNDDVVSTDLDLLDSNQRFEVILLSANSKQALIKLLQDLIPTVKRISRAELTDFSAALCNKQDEGIWRVGVVTESPWQLVTQLERIIIWLLDNNESGWQQIDDKIFVGQAKENPKCVALYPGQASQRVNMSEFAYRHFPKVRELYNHVDVALQELMPDSLISKILVNPYTVDDNDFQQAVSDLKNTNIAQPGIVFSSISTLAILRQVGIEPNFNIGHSLGEISALHAAGVFSDIDAVRFAALRGNTMMDAEEGGMAAIATNAEEVQKLLKDNDVNLTIANYNSPRQTVVSGNLLEIEKLQKIQNCENLTIQPLAVSNAFHSASMVEAGIKLGTHLEEFNLLESDDSVISTVTGKRLNKNSNIKELLTQQVSSTVFFTDAVQQALEEQPDIWIEVGPSQVLSNLVRDIATDKILCLPTDIAKEESSASFGRVLACAYVIGFPITKRTLFENRFYRKLDIDNYSPKFIVSPTENPVDDPNTIPIVNDIGVREMQPVGVDAAEFRHYLDNRSNYLKNFIEFDFQQFQENHENISKQEIQHQSINSSEEQETNSEDIELDIMSRAINWISNRTGFSVSDIQPHMKLRDDLNLDSIKTGELIVEMHKALDTNSNISRATLANVTVSELIRQLSEETDQPTVSPMALDSTIEFQPMTYQVQLIDMPIKSAHDFMLTNEKICIISEQNNQTANSFSSYVKNCTKVNFDEFLNGSLSKSASAIFLFLPERLSNNYLNLVGNKSHINEFAEFSFSLFKRISEIDSRIIIIRSCDKDEPSIVDMLSVGVKSLQWEKGSKSSKYLTLPASLDTNKILLDEYECDEPAIAVYYSKKGNRQVPVSKSSFTKKEEMGALNLNNNDVVLITGGGKGITFELAYVLAKKFDVKLALLGSSKFNSDINDELSINLKKLEKENIEFKYFQCDVADETGVRNACQAICDSLGQITGILHGAGINNPERFESVTKQDYFNCINVKALGLHNILQSTKIKNIKFFHVISSVLAKSGMEGNVDYTFANAWLDGAINKIAIENPKLHCISIGYSVWAQTGMGIKLGAVDSLQKVGVSTLSTEAGSAAYVELFNHFWSNPLFTTTGRITQELERTMFLDLPEKRSRFLQDIIRYIPGREIITDCTYNTTKDLYLKDHIFNGTIILPGVIGIEAMVAVAKACVELEIKTPIISKINFVSPIIVPKEGDLKVRVHAIVMDKNIVKIKVSSNGKMHYEAEADFSEIDYIEDKINIEKYQNKAGVNPDLFVPTPLFQGKLFRNIESVLELEPEITSTAQVRVPNGEQYFSDQEKYSKFTTCPAVNDSFLQVGALLLPHGFLPESIASWSQHKSLPRGELVFCQAKGNKIDQNTYSANIKVFDKKGTLIQSITELLLKRSNNSVSNSNLINSAKRLGTESGLFIEIDWYEKPLIKREDISLRNKNLVQSLVKNYLIEKKISVKNIEISHDLNGKPYINLDSSELNLNVSIADTTSLSIAAIHADQQVGIDAEWVEEKPIDVWQQLLGEHLYSIAKNISEFNLDVACTICWTVHEALIKLGRDHTTPEFVNAYGNTVLMSAEKGNIQIRSKVCTENPKICLTVANISPYLQN